MSTYIESGHAKNTANFDHLIALLLTYGTNYTPSTANLAITNLQTVLTNAQGALTTVKNEYNGWKNATNSREIALARSVLFNITKQQYVNACEKGDVSSSHRFASTSSSIQKSEVSLYPNPSNGNITLQSADDLSYTITVYNILGEKVFESSASNTQSINLSHLSSATYIVKIHSNGSLIKTERISIIH